MKRVLLVEDDITFSNIVASYLGRQGISCICVPSLKKALKALDGQAFDLCLLDYHLPDGTGLDIVSELRRRSSGIPAIMMTSYNDVRLAVSAVKMGVQDYITKPVNQEELLHVVQEYLSKPPKKTKQPEGAALPDHGPAIVHGVGKAWKQLHGQVMLVAPTDLSVLIMGESGTGKENIAKMLHAGNKRCNSPFVAVDCGTLSKELAGSELFGHEMGAFTGAVSRRTGKFEEAKGGTLFLDEIGNLAPDVQVKLLRALQEKVIQPVGSDRHIAVDVRIVAATNEDLKQKAQDGGFREDLYHRLNEFSLFVPPLRNRREDLPLFIDHFVQEANRTLDRKVMKLAPEVQHFFDTYDWPGNIRELKNVVRRMVLLTNGEVAGSHALPEEMMLTGNKAYAANDPTTTDLKAMQQNGERDMIVKVLQEVQYNKTKAARILNIDRSTLYAKM
ncbi:MAG TPA: sigma-54 dependent transcriptional regulator, partial [Phnomibacter sp.]|nr:sigma-54 dependent transcriptional regulator [Phnomibacter sp.]